MLKAIWPILEPATPWVDGWVVGCECEHLEAFFAGQIKKLIINMPPRHGKSLRASVALFVWAWAKRPETRWIYSSYSDMIVTRDSMKCRDVINHPWFQDRWGGKFRLKADRNRQDLFWNDRQGFRMSTTPGGAATGEGAEFLAYDDPLSAEQARSKADRERAFRFWTQTMGTRFNNIEQIGRLVTMQRFDRADVTGRLIAEEHGYETLILPIEAEPKRFFFPERDPIEKRPKDYIVPTTLQQTRPELMDNRKAGDILWPERFTKSAIDELKKTVGPGGPGQLYQRPSQEGGSVVRASNFKPAYEVWEDGELFIVLGDAMDGMPAKKVKAKDCFWFQTADTAMSAKDSACPTVIGTFCKTPTKDLLVYHIFRNWLDYPDQWPALRRLRYGNHPWDRDKQRWRFGERDITPWPFALSWQGVEPKATGESLLQTARNEGLPLRRLNVEDGDKMKRGAFLVTMYENGQVYHLASGPWRPEFEDELTDVPNGAYDDQFDVAAYAAMYCIQDALTAYSGPLVYNELEPTVSNTPDVFKKREQPTDRSMTDLLDALKGPKPAAAVIDDQGIHLLQEDHQ